MNISGRGGKRDKAGRKSTWPSGCRFQDTKLIRVPKYLAEKLMQIAKELDSKRAKELNSKKAKKLYSDKNLDSVTKSREEPTQPPLPFKTKSTDTDFSSQKLPIIPGKLLAKRLNITPSKLSTKKKKLYSDKNLDSANKLKKEPTQLSLPFIKKSAAPENLFCEWSQSKDPDRIKWISIDSSSKSKGYKPSSDISIELVTKLNKWIKENTK